MQGTGRRRIATFAGIALLCAFPAIAQDADTTGNPRERVRVLTKAGQTIVGTLKGWNHDGATLVLDGKTEDLRIARNDVGQLHRWAGKRSALVEGALAGGALGVAVPMIFGKLICGCDDFAPDLAVRDWGRITIPLGLALGAVIGDAHKVDLWERVDPKDLSRSTLRLGWAPAKGRGLGANLSYSW
jgi:hypothetical protein